MKISVIATGYNCEKYAKECIESVLEQSYEDFELLIYNDASTDDTANICAPYVDSKNVWLMNSKTNLGALYGRHTLTRVATGDIICFLGLDDMLSSHALEEVARAYKDEEVLMTWGAWVSDDGKIQPRIQNYPKDVWQDRNFRSASWRATALNTFKKELLLRVPKEKLMNHGRFLTNCTDLAYSFPCLEMINEHNTRLIHSPIYIYRYKHGNTTRSRLGIKNKTKVREYLKQIKPLERCY